MGVALKGVVVAIPNRFNFSKRLWESWFRTDLISQKGCGSRDSEQIKNKGVGIANPNKKNAQKGCGGRESEQN